MHSAYELLSAEPPVMSSSVQGEIVLQPVTADTLDDGIFQRCRSGRDCRSKVQEIGILQGGRPSFVYK
eukprot:scaffold7866_cov147-Amphora_coffeaeformis.AAC.1